MRSIKRTLAFVAVTLLAACALFAPTAALGKNYTYTVRFLPGAKGEFQGQTEFTVNYGDEVTFQPKSVTVKDDKYYVMGIREAGKDNSTVDDVSFKVTEDVDYVVAYGIKGEQVAYTVSYVAADGTELAPTETHYGNVGDTPVVAYVWVDGYEPNYTNQSKTLKANAADNAFTFTYSPIPEGETTVTTTVVDLGTTTTPAAAAAAPAAAAAAPAAAVVAPAAEAAAGGAAAGAAAGGAAGGAAAGAAAGTETIGGNATPTAGPGATTGTGTGTGTGAGNGTETIPSEGGPTAGPGATTTATQGVPMPMLVIGALAVIGAIAAIATRLTMKDGE